jgi:hypothetical protein
MPATRRFRHGNLENQASNERRGLLIPVGIARHARFVEHEGVGQRVGVFGDIEAVGIKHVEGIECGGASAGDAEWIEDMNRPELLSRAARDPGVLSLGIDADHRTLGRQQIGNDGAHALACSCRRHGQQMGRSVIAQLRVR